MRISACEASSHWITTTFHRLEHLVIRQAKKLTPPWLAKERFEEATRKGLSIGIEPPWCIFALSGNCHMLTETDIPTKGHKKKNDHSR